MAEPVRIGDLLGSLPGLNDRLAEARLVETWPAIAGPASARSRAEGVAEGVLHVLVDSSGWLHRLTLEESRLIARCREIAAIRAIRFRLASPRNPMAARAAGSTAPGDKGEVDP